ncbi:Exophilin-5 [Pteropus alecto]|uniref:Exophilin-5 n=1 Tax=Pteropus alecto TaxID=9402 RepID=L5KLB4_PTEAL|nr:Exophilin-5 [Pteropus alecto]
MTYISLTRTATPGELNISDSSAVHVTELHDRNSPHCRRARCSSARIEYPVCAAAKLYNSPLENQPIDSAFVPKPAGMREGSGVPPWDASLLENEFFRVLDDLDSKLAQEQSSSSVNTRTPINYESRTRFSHFYSSGNGHGNITGRHKNHYNETSNMSIYDILRPGTPREGFKTFSPRTRTIYDMYRTREPRVLKEDYVQKNTFGSASLCFDSRQQLASPATGYFTTRSLHFPATIQNKSGFIPSSHQQSPKRTPLSSIIWNRSDSCRDRQNQEELRVPSPMEIDPADQYMYPKCSQEDRRYEFYRSQGVNRSISLNSPMDNAMSPDPFENSENMPFYHQDNPFAKSFFSNTFGRSREQRSGQSPFGVQQEEYSSWSGFHQSRKPFTSSDRDFEMISTEANNAATGHSHSVSTQHWGSFSPSYGTNISRDQEEPHPWQFDSQTTTLESMEVSQGNRNQMIHFSTPNLCSMTSSSYPIKPGGLECQWDSSPTEVHVNREPYSLGIAQTLASSFGTSFPQTPDDEGNSQSSSIPNPTVTLQKIKPASLPLRSYTEVTVTNSDSADSPPLTESQPNILVTEVNNEKDLIKSVSEKDKLNKMDYTNRTSVVPQPVSQTIISNPSADFQNPLSQDSAKSNRFVFNASTTISSKKSPKVISRKDISKIHISQREKANELQKDKRYTENRKLGSATSFPFIWESRIPSSLPSPNQELIVSNEGTSSIIKNNHWSSEPTDNQNAQSPEKPAILGTKEEQCAKIHSTDHSKSATGHNIPCVSLGLSSGIPPDSSPSNNSFLDALVVPSTTVFFKKTPLGKDPSWGEKEEKDSDSKNQNNQLTLSPSENQKSDDSCVSVHNEVVDVVKCHVHPPFRAGKGKGKVRRRISYIEQLSKTERVSCASVEKDEKERCLVSNMDASAITLRPEEKTINPLESNSSVRDSSITRRHHQKEYSQECTEKDGKIAASSTSMFSLLNEDFSPFSSGMSEEKSGKTLYKFKTTSMFSVSGDEDNVKCLEIVSVYYTLPRKHSKKFCDLLQKYTQNINSLTESTKLGTETFPNALEKDKRSSTQEQSGTPSSEDPKMLLSSAQENSLCRSHNTENVTVSQLPSIGPSLQEMSSIEANVSLHKGEPKTREISPDNLTKIPLSESQSRKDRGKELQSETLCTSSMLQEKKVIEEKSENCQKSIKSGNSDPSNLPANSEENVENPQTRRSSGECAGSGIAITATGSRKCLQKDITGIAKDDGFQPRKVRGEIGADFRKKTDKSLSDSESQVFALSPALHKLQLDEGTCSGEKDLDNLHSEPREPLQRSQEVNLTENSKAKDEMQRLAWDQLLLPARSNKNKISLDDLGKGKNRSSVKQRLAPKSKTSRKFPAKDLSPRRHVATIFPQSGNSSDFSDLSLGTPECNPLSPEPIPKSTESTDKSRLSIDGMDMGKSKNPFQVTITSKREACTHLNNQKSNSISGPHQNEFKNISELLPTYENSKDLTVAQTLERESGTPAQPTFTSLGEASFSDHQRRRNPHFPLKPAEKSTISTPQAGYQQLQRSAVSLEWEAESQPYRSKSLKSISVHGDLLRKSHPPKARGRHFSEGISTDNALSQLTLGDEFSNSGCNRRFKSFSELSSCDENESWALYSGRTKTGPKSATSISRPIDYGIFGKEQQLAFLENVKRSLTQGRLWKPSFLKNPGFLKDDIINPSNPTESSSSNSSSNQMPEDGLSLSMPLNIYEEDPVDSDGDTDTTTDDEYYLDENDKESEL